MAETDALAPRFMRIKRKPVPQQQHRSLSIQLCSSSAAAFAAEKSTRGTSFTSARACEIAVSHGQPAWSLRELAAPTVHHTHRQSAHMQ
ncbi:hypothetical protein Bxe_B3029 [Paraburkholderia xenovorans LB400]|uniref:Uncharacterized protein n=1 Tax=Paraburkholderia xenovorans (strain LB400) TaxID=266265 RepID=Q13J11_PARXL|nr:hypothetical protein Bxe_B3029 [Paraburkholderia xenovorans LB400]